MLGALGRMGSLLCATIARQDDLTLVARVDSAGEVAGSGASPGAAGPADAPLFATLDDALVSVRPDVAVDFTVPSAVFGSVAGALGAGLPTVVGTTGLTDDQVARLSALAAERHAALLIVPNFALGAVLLMQFAAQAARYFPAAEIIELHERDKVDAPSGTSLLTARLMTEAGAAHPHGAGETRPSRVWRAAACASTACGCRVWWPIRRSSSAARGRRSPSATTRCRANPSWPAPCWPSAGCPRSKGPP